MDLLLGCGNTLAKRVFALKPHWDHLVTLDIDPACEPDVLHDLNNFPYPFDDDTFEEIHAYEVLEHVGRQGDWRFFFDQFTELWRILVPGGLLAGSVPRLDSVWAWGDPGHTRVIPPDALCFLDQRAYEQVGRTTMTDYRGYYHANYIDITYDFLGDSMYFTMVADKTSPS